MIQRACPACEVNDARPLWAKPDVTLVQCTQCGMVFASPVPEAMASGEHYAGLAESLYLSPDKLAADYAPVRFERELRVFREFCLGTQRRSGGGGEGGSEPKTESRREFPCLPTPSLARSSAPIQVLDLGCSTGGFLHQLETRWPGEYERLGMDVVGPALDHAESKGVPVLRGAFLEHDFGGRQFDAITLWAVVEHLVEPAKFLARAAVLLRPGGHCFVLVPNLRSLAMRLLGPRYRYVMAEHVNYFSDDTLRQFVTGVPELEVVALRSTHFNPVVIWQDWRDGGRPVPDAERVALLKRTTAWKQRGGLMRWCHRMTEGLLGCARLADNLVIVARRR